MDGNPTPKAGCSSSEFAALVVAILGAVGGVGTDIVQADTAATIVGGLIALYTLCRTAIKIAHSLGYAKQVAELPELKQPAGKDEALSKK